MAAQPDGKNTRPIIIKKVEEGGHGGHHGGAWKVAYADFVTAMMAFFLLLWLLGSTTEEQRKGIADYFSPTTAASSSMSGSGGVMGGVTITIDGPMVNTGSPIAAPGSPSGFAQAVGGDPDAEESGQTEGTTRLNREADHDTSDVDAESLEQAVREATERGDTETLERLEKALEDQRFEKVEQALREALNGLPDLSDLAENVKIDRTAEGLRIQIVDQARYSMFPSGSSQMPGRTAELLGLVTKAVSGLPNKVSIRGHTDAHPYAAGSGRDNWILSAERANATRLAMVQAGLEPGRLANVVGLADTDPYVPANPLDPQNRRMSIVLLTERRAG
jgi:chemotaxis protein MotB